MKKLLLLAMGMLVSTLVYAQTTGELYFQGGVAAVNTLTITPNANATTLNIAGGESNKIVGFATETSNNANGYTILMRTANGSRLHHSIAGATYNVPYTVSYDGATTPALSTVDQAVKTVSPLSQLTTDSSDVLVSLDPHPELPTGSYTDVITISISTN